MIRLTLLLALAAVVLNRHGVQSVNGQSVAFPFAFRFMPFKFSKRGDDPLLDWPSWTMLKAGPYALRQFPRVNSVADRPPSAAGRDEYNYGVDTLDENGKLPISSSTRALGLCHFKICPVGKRSQTSGKVKPNNSVTSSAPTSSALQDMSSSEVDYSYSEQK